MAKNKAKATDELEPNAETQVSPAELVDDMDGGAEAETEASEIAPEPIIEESQQPEPMDATTVPDAVVSGEIPAAEGFHPFDAISGPPRSAMQSRVAGIMGFSTDRARDSIRCLGVSEMEKFYALLAAKGNTNQEIRTMLNNAIMRSQKPKVEKGE